MTILMPLVLVGLSLATILALMAAVRHVGRRQDWPAEAQRKAVHVATGLLGLALPLLFDETWPVAVLVGCAVAIMLVLRLPGLAALGGALHTVGRQSWGDIFLVVAIGFLFLRSADTYVTFALPIAVIALSDAAAALAGTTYGRRHFTVAGSTKSAEGVAVFFLITLVVSMVTLLLASDVDRVNVVLLALMIAAMGAMIEADSWSGLDNLFVPLAIHFFLVNNLDTPPPELGLLAAGFLAFLVLLQRAAPRLGLDAHTARAYVVILFVVLSVTALHNAVQPAISVIAFALIFAGRPEDGARQHLDLIVAIALIGLFWLMAGRVTGSNAINFYDLTFGCATVLMTATVTRRYPLPAIAGLIVAAAAFAIAVEINPSDWHGPLWGPAAAGLVVCLTVGLSASRWFNHHRVAKLSAVALMVPLVSFATLFVLQEASPP